ncbi:Uncharacterised protein [Vibrio cholerae]|nr:Uncharacterised protein [Vibrio cholerae]
MSVTNHTDNRANNASVTAALALCHIRYDTLIARCRLAIVKRHEMPFPPNDGTADEWPLRCITGSINCVAGWKVITTIQHQIHLVDF